MALTHLRRGDVVFTYDADGTAMHKIIANAQRVGGSSGSRASVHAAIASGNGFQVFESVGGGLRASPLKPGVYRVYCYRGPSQKEIREFATAAAETYVTHRQLDPAYGDYAKLKAALSPVRSSSHKYSDINKSTRQFGAEAKAPKTFFCSNFIFRCYAAAAELVGSPNLPIPDSRAQISPRDLEGLLIKSPWWHARNHGHEMTHP